MHFKEIQDAVIKASAEATSVPYEEHKWFIEANVDVCEVLARAVAYEIITQEQAEVIIASA